MAITVPKKTLKIINDLLRLVGFGITYLSMTPEGGGNSHVKAYRDVPPKWVTFSPKILKHGSHLGQKILRRGSHFTKIAKKL